MKKMWIISLEGLVCGDTDEINRGITCEAQDMVWGRCGDYSPYNQIDYAIFDDDAIRPTPAPGRGGSK